MESVPRMRKAFRVVSDPDEVSGISDGEGECASGRPPAHLSDRLSFVGWVVGGLVVAGALSFFADLPVSQALNHDRWLKSIHRTLELAEPFGDFFGVVLVAVGVWVLHPAGRKQMPLLVLGVATAGLAADVVKLSVGRIRPTNLDWSGVRSVADTFTGWLPIVNGGWKNQSFPSAHTATAWALAMFLVRLYPRGRWFFPVIAGLVGLQRVETGSHYLSDAVFGAAIGIGVSCLWLRTGLFRDFLPIERDETSGSGSAGNEWENEGREFRERDGESSVG